jgi:hypothetical protein
MSEFCVSCWNELNNTRLKDKDVLVDKHLDLCEGCGELKPTIICYRKKGTFCLYIRYLFTIARQCGYSLKCSLKKPRPRV